ncbi:Maf family protein [Nesterenkonia lacusekhoensis]|uniref:Nucleoside triphosphate pyrophosphatase n=1 Tax=Nesterenkonia lacusekhoensis TaxID=150832 RepID=A0ABS4SYH6_9MICC|nr:Maf family protein [Nesterenkonia lacusekhoensis]MBP2317252.1 septum formation protein [Nesterenkonia lacusekhoensis]
MSRGPGSTGRMPRLILASASPARKEILSAAGIEFDVVVSDVDERAAVETYVENAGPLSPADEALMLARTKAEDVASRNEARNALVLGCDSVFELDGAAYGKPYEVEVAVQRWQQMRGNTGTLHTGHWLVDTTGASLRTATSWLDRAFGVFTGGTLAVDGELTAAAETVSSDIAFGQPTDEQIRAYAESGEGLNCAGAFTLEGQAAEHIERVDGDRESVIGVSTAALGRLLERLDHDITEFQTS